MKKNINIKYIKTISKKYLGFFLRLLKLTLKIFLVFLVVSIGMIFISLFKYSDLTLESVDNNSGVGISDVIDKDLIITPKEYRRGADQTFLTFPEWFLVFAPQSQADFLNKYTNSNYPYLADTAGIWQSYRIVYDEIKNKYEFNTGYHFMILVIATSSSVEYNLKALYESTIGSIFDTELNKTYEDKFYGKFANNYVDFIYDIPWYEFDFLGELKNFNSNNSFIGENFLRKTERKIVINIELYTKYLYSKIIKSGTAGIYNPALPNTVVLLDRIPENLVNVHNLDLDNIKFIESIDSGSKEYYLVSIPRYDKFKNYSLLLAENNINFIEIAGNNGDILISILQDSNNKDLELKNINNLFEQKIVTSNLVTRKVFTTKVGNLKNVLNEINNNKLFIEHIFDY